MLLQAHPSFCLKFLFQFLGPNSLKTENYVFLNNGKDVFYSKIIDEKYPNYNMVCLMTLNVVTPDIPDSGVAFSEQSPVANIAEKEAILFGDDIIAYSS